jgi:hypothetical protein
MSSLLHIDTVKKLLSDGKTESAVDALIQFTEVENLKQYNQSAILLKNRIELLQQQMIEGTISQADSSLESAKISKGTLILVSNIEQKLEAANAEKKPEKPKYTTPSVSLPWRKIATLGIPALVVSILFYRFVINPTVPQPFDLNLNIVKEKNIQDVHDLKIIIKINNEVLAEKNIAENETISLKNIKGNLKNKKITLQLSDTSDYYLANQNILNATENTPISVELWTKSTLYKGKIVHFDDTPARYAIVDIEKGMIRDTTDNEGNYEIHIPNYMKEGQRIFLTIYDNKGATALAETVRLSEAVLQSKRIH